MDVRKLREHLREIRELESLESQRKAEERAAGERERREQAAADARAAEREEQRLTGTLPLPPRPKAIDCSKMTAEEFEIYKAANGLVSSGVAPRVDVPGTTLPPGQHSRAFLNWRRYVQQCEDVKRSNANAIAEACANEPLPPDASAAELQARDRLIRGTAALTDPVTFRDPPPKPTGAAGRADPERAHREADAIARQLAAKAAAGEDVGDCSRLPELVFRAYLEHRFGIKR